MIGFTRLRALPVLSLLLLLGIYNASSFSSSSRGSSNNNNNVNIQYRQGAPQDKGNIAATLLKELMNPLGVQTERFVVATTTLEGDATRPVTVGWAQIKPLGRSPTDANVQRDPFTVNARPGSYSLDQEIDDQLWDDFETNDNIQVPTGWASLPWTKEYRTLQQAIQDRNAQIEVMRQERKTELLRNPQSQLWELSSVFVEAPYRGQGIGAELVRRVVRQRLTTGCMPTSIYLLTLATTAPWYNTNFGFDVVEASDVPAPMALEVAAGSIITKLIGAQLCCMRGTEKTIELCS